MADELAEEELLRSIEEVDARIRKFRKRVRALLATIQTQGQQAPPGEKAASAG
jgi:hypothetical protein